MQVETLELQSEKNRKRLVEIVYKAKAGHIGGDLSCLNVLTALYFDIMRVWPDKPKEPKRDRFVMSKGHCVEALYVTLEAKGFISRDISTGEFYVVNIDKKEHVLKNYIDSLGLKEIVVQDDWTMDGLFISHFDDTRVK